MTTSISDAPVSSLRQHMIDDTTLRRITSKTKFDYVRRVARFAA